MFTDIANYWAQPCINHLSQARIINGYPDKTFRPNAAVTRAEFAVLISNTFPTAPITKNSISFTDVPRTHWAAKAIEIATKKGFLSGYPDRTFQPDRPIPKIQATIALAAHLKATYPDIPNLSITNYLNQYFDDASQVPSYATNLLAAATSNYLVMNYPQVRKLEPNRPTTRGEISALLCLALQYHLTSPSSNNNLANVIPWDYVPGGKIFLSPPQLNNNELFFSEGLASVKIQNKYGFMDQTGKVVITPKFDSVKYFINGFAQVQVGQKWGLINRSSNLVLPIEYDDIGYFLSGLAVINKGNLLGAIDLTGKIIVPPRFNEINGELIPSLIKVRLNHKYGLLDRTGKTILATEYEEIMQAPSNNLLIIKQNNQYGIVDRLGKIVITPQYDQLVELAPNLWRVQRHNQFGLIDLTNKIILPIAYNKIGYFYENLAQIVTNNKYGFVDKDGKIIIDIKFDYEDHQSYFKEGLAAIKINSKYGFIDTSGNIIIPPQFDEVKDFHQAIALVKSNDKYGIIDRQGNFILTPQFDEIGNFENGLAQIRENNKYGLIDQTGKILISPQLNAIDWEFGEHIALIKDNYDTGIINKKTGQIIAPLQRMFISRFREGMAQVLIAQTGQLNFSYGFINTFGQMVITPQFSNAKEFSEGLVAVAVGDKFGFIDQTGKMIIGPQFEDARYFQKGMAAIKINGKWGLIDRTGKMIIPPNFFAVNNQDYIGSPEANNQAITILNDQLILVRLGDKCGIVDRAGKWIVFPTFTDINYIQEGIARVNFGGQWTIEGRGNDGSGGPGEFVAVIQGGKWGYIKVNN